MDARTLVSELQLSPAQFAVQLSQTEFRQKLVGAWDIQPGSAVLEIGCGQGDMTLVLADAVGGAGHVTALDAAPAGSGSPSTFATAAERIRRTTPGKRIRFVFGADLLEPALALPLLRYDAAILAHSSWYFASLDMFQRTLERVATWSDRLCLSEWDLQPTSPSQIPHLLAALFQGRMSAHGLTSDGNIQTLMSRATIQRCVDAAGWQIDEVMSVDSTNLQDARWEIANSLALLGPRGDIDVADVLQGLDFGAIRALIGSWAVDALSSFTLSCHRR